jgi:hypothetical protein
MKVDSARRRQIIREGVERMVSWTGCGVGLE